MATIDQSVEPSQIFNELIESGILRCHDHYESNPRSDAIIYRCVRSILSSKFSEADIDNFTTYDFLNSGEKFPDAEYKLLTVFYNQVRVQWVERLGGPVAVGFVMKSVDGLTFSSPKFFPSNEFTAPELVRARRRSTVGTKHLLTIQGARSNTRVREELHEHCLTQEWEGIEVN